MKKIILLINFLIISVFFIGSETQAGTKDHFSGWAWSDMDDPTTPADERSIGWVSFNCYNDYNNDDSEESHCLDAGFDSDYGVDIEPSTGKISGSAWSENVGWVSFDRAKTFSPPSDDPCPDGTCIARIDLNTGQVFGWARVLSACQDNLWDDANKKCTGSGAGDKAGGWDGWIILSSKGTEMTAVDSGELNSSGRYTSLELDVSGNPVVAYLDDANADIKLVRCNDAYCRGQNEVFQVLDANVAADNAYISLELDSNNYPVVAYYDDNNDKIKVIHCNDANCSPLANGPEQIKEVYAGQASYVNLKLLNGKPVIAFFDGSYPYLVLCQDTDCDAVSGAINMNASAANTGQGLSLAIDSAGKPVIVYYNMGNNYLKLARCENPLNSPPCTSISHTAMIVGFSWTERYPPGGAPADKFWNSVSSDYDGSNLIAAAFWGRLYTSSDYGTSWIKRDAAGDADKNWRTVASDADGSNLIAAVNNGRLYTSDNSGGTWTKRDIAGDVDKQWRTVASDADGSHLIAGIYNGRLYTSDNSGQTWTERRPLDENVDKKWQAVASDADGSNLIAAVSEGRLYTSSDYGETWTKRDIAGDVNRYWSAVASDADGSRLIAASNQTSIVNGGRLYTSSNYGASWTERYPPGGAPAEKQWVAVSSDSDGSNLIATISMGRLYTSDNSGQTWTERQPAGDANKPWSSVSSDSDGSNLIVSMSSGRLYTSNDYSHMVGQNSGITSLSLTALKLDSSNKPIIAYHSTDSLIFIRCDDQLCDGQNETVRVLDGVLAGGNKVGKYASLDLDASGRPVVAYQDYNTANNSDLKFVYCKDVNCLTRDVVTLDNFDNTGGWPSLKVNGTKPVIAYNDWLRTGTGLGTSLLLTSSDASLFSPAYGVFVQTEKSSMIGYAWSNMVVGWLRFQGANYKVKVTLNRPPTIPPGSLEAKILPNEYCGVNPSHYFKWGFSDAEDGMTQTAYQLQIANDSGFSSIQFDSGYVLSASTERYISVSTSPTGEFADGVADGTGQLGYNSPYYWRVRVYDSQGESSDWFVYQDNSPPPDSFATALHSFPAPSFIFSPSNPSAEEMVSATSTSQSFGGALSCLWEINPPTPGGGTFVPPTTENSCNPKIKFSILATLLKLTVTDSANYACATTSPILPRLPLPDWIEVPPTGFVSKLLAAIANFLRF